jgi:hypothetical protein
MLTFFCSGLLDAEFAFCVALRVEDSLIAGSHGKTNGCSAMASVAVAWNMVRKWSA